MSQNSNAQKCPQAALPPPPKGDEQSGQATFAQESAVPQATEALSRRRLFAGVGAAGAVAAAAAVLPLSKSVTAVVAEAAPVAAKAGYQLTEHVQRYYQTARV